MKTVQDITTIASGADTAGDEKLASPRESAAGLSGLSESEARRRLTAFGYNEPVTIRRLGPVLEFLSYFLNPLIVILLIAGTISFFVGNWVSASIIISMVLLSVVLNFTQSYRSRKAVEQLQSGITPTAAVLRDGSWREVPRREVVPEDVIRLGSGDLAPADARLIESRSLYVQESVLTGESLPVEKSAAATRETAEQDRDCVFLGTSVISGTATAVVTETGRQTRFGQIAEQLTKKVPETEFERGTRKFGYLIARVVLCLVVFVFFVNALLHRDPLESLLFSIALAVGLTPEFLPMIVTVTLAQGATRMAKKKVVVKHLEAIQNFGSIDILCSDKTGTLTKGEMSLSESVDPLGRPSELPAYMAYINGRFETGVSNPLDKAITAQSVTERIEKFCRQDGRPGANGFGRIDEIPFDFERRRVSVVTDGGGHRLLITKGAPESVLAACSRYETSGGSFSLDAGKRQICERVFDELSSRGLRVLAVAYCKPLAKARYTIDDETGLTLVGYLAFADEPLESSAEALQSLRRDGVAVKILTGDNELVAGYVCQKVGLDRSRIVLGSEVDRMTDPALAVVAQECNVFARVSPVQKNRILLALKSRGHVVGFLGDGINDAPSLRSADVGISVSTASDVAKEAAQILLLERSLKAIHNGIIEGRKSFGNVMKYLLMGTSSNFGNMFSMAGAVIFLPFLPMLPMQILLNNFLYDLAQITIPTDNVDRSFVRKPHRWNIKLIRNFMVMIGPISSIYDFLTFFVLLKVFHATEQLFQTGWFVESLATQTMVVFVIRTAGNPFRSRPSRPLSFTVLAVVAAALLLPFTPVAAALGFVPLPAAYFAFLITATLTYLVLVEVSKRYLFRGLID